MASNWCFVALLLAFASLAFATRANICLASGSAIYRPLQLYPSDCPNNSSQCMAAVYNYSAAAFASKEPATIKPKVNQGWVYLTQDQYNNFDLVLEFVTSYENTVINATCNVTGAAPAQMIVQDDPTQDTYQWNPSTNTGAFTWYLQPTYTDGIVLGHFQPVGYFCVLVTVNPNWGGSIANIVFMTGNVTNPVPATSQPLNSVTDKTYFEFCQFPDLAVTWTDATCIVPGSASAASLNGTASYAWTNSSGAQIATTPTVTGLSAGTYSVTVTVAGCDATKTVTIGSSTLTYSVAINATVATRQSLGTISLSITGGYPAKAITFANSAGLIIAANVTTVTVAMGTYTVAVSDGCTMNAYSVTVGGPATCYPGTIIDPNSQGCLVCPAGTYSAATGATACTPCPVGESNNAANSSSCNICPANTYTSGGSDACSSCLMNTYSLSGSGFCSPCPPGTDRSSASANCSSCAPGYFRCDPASLCAPCVPGTYSGSGYLCEMCDPGTYQATAGQTGCTGCPVNTYSAAGNPSCLDCPWGTSSQADSTSMAACM